MTHEEIYFIKRGKRSKLDKQKQSFHVLNQIHIKEEQPKK